MFASYKKFGSLNPFRVTNLRPEVELMYSLRMRRHYCYVWNRRHWTLSVCNTTYTISDNINCYNESQLL